MRINIVNIITMVQLNGLDVPLSKNGSNNNENENIRFSKDDMESNGKAIPITTDLQSTSKVFIHTNSDILLFPALDYGDESPAYILEASDPFMNPELYKRYSICKDIEDTFPERLAKQIENIKDVTRDRAVTSITAGENAVYWLVNTFKYLTSGWLGLVIILLTVIVYGSLGALIFMLLESPSEEIYSKQISDIRRELTIKIANSIRNVTIMMTNQKFLQLLEDDLVEYEKQYSEFSKHVQNNNVSENTWNFANSFIFAGTIFTTIGYGHICPKTTAGRAATIVYAIIGIPLFLIALTSFGKFLTKIIKFFWKYILICCSKRSIAPEEKKEPSTDMYRPALVEDNFELLTPHIEGKKYIKPETAPSIMEIDEEFDLPITLALSILILYMLIGAVIAHYFESWSFFEAFYCVFISMSTIGLGDFVVSNSMHMIYSIVYIIFGLSLTAMCIDVVQKNLTVMFKHACEKIMMLVDETDH